ncbi:polysaccharide deacetylase family protein [Paraclostridium bifermentans]|uniref:Polysaccharide deacetylase family protein n=1 Tax=Paraclostridium bifermentans TaxID=1490 RepID=A0A5P3XHV4_PARBF|nr:polysaccharide deacetylase family protein [Paraclostridium bifermentans]QEZ69940.1 polysaccharide deacetylase family protein [Paraclostridium bifermentans]
MKKLIIPIFFLILALGIFNMPKSNESEVFNNKNNISKKYEDIIIKRGSDQKKVIALTFDDGPDEDFTPQILDILKKNNAKATFFVVGQKVGWNPEIVKRAFDEGHEIGNHTFTHINVCNNSPEKLNSEIIKTQEIIKKVTGKEPTWFRPPYRAINESLFNLMKSKDMKVVLWSDFDARDWSNPGVGNIISTIEKNAKNGSIVLLHDYNSIRNDKSQTIKALECIIPELQKQGYEFVTISDLVKE